MENLIGIALAIGIVFKLENENQYSTNIYQKANSLIHGLTIGQIIKAKLDENFPNNAFGRMIPARIITKILLSTFLIKFGTIIWWFVEKKNSINTVNSD